MKKLMVAFAAIAVAVSANASLCKWSFSTTSTTAGLDGSTIYVMLGSTIGDYKTLEDITGAANLYGSGVDTTTMTMPVASTSASGTIDSAKLTSSSPNFYYVLVNADESGYWVSDVVDATKANKGQTALYEQGSGSPGAAKTAATVSGFTDFQGVPEPTSGLLLLVGVAGLALRRRRA